MKTSIEIELSDAQQIQLTKIAGLTGTSISGLLPAIVQAAFNQKLKEAYPAVLRKYGTDTADPIDWEAAKK